MILLGIISEGQFVSTSATTTVLQRGAKQLQHDAVYDKLWRTGYSGSASCLARGQASASRPHEASLGRVSIPKTGTGGGIEPTRLAAGDFESEAVQRHSIQHLFLKVHPWLDSLRSDPRYGEILKRMNLAD